MKQTSTKLGPCREYEGSRNPDGYGRVPFGPPRSHRDGRRAGRKLVGLHRWVVEQVEGPLAPGEVVRHRCDNPPCFLYAHLIRGTQGDNMQDAALNDRWAKLSAEQVADIRRRRAEGEGVRALAHSFGVHRTTVQAVLHGRCVR